MHVQTSTAVEIRHECYCFYVDAFAYSFFGVNDCLAFCEWNSLGVRQIIVDVKDDGDGDEEND